MKLLMKYVLRNLNENLGRTVLIMLSLLVVAIIVSIATLGSLFLEMFAEAGNNAFSYEYEIECTTSENFSKKVIEELKKSFNLLGVSEFDYGYIMDEEENYNSVALEGLDIETAIDFNFIKIGTTDNVELKQNEVIITSDISKKYDLDIGDEFEYYGRNGEKNLLKVKYIIKSFMAINPQLKIVTNEEEYLNIKGKEDCSYYWLCGNYIGNTDLIDENIEKLENDLGLKISNGTLEGEKIDTYINIAMIVGVFVFAVIFVSLNSIVKIIINERISEIGTFRSVGATKSQVMIMLVLELLIYSVIPSFIGGALGVSVLKGLEKVLNYSMEISGSSTEISMINYLLPISVSTVLITVLFQLLLSAAELIKVSKMSIKDTIFNKHVSIYKYSVLKIVIGIIFLSIGIISLFKYKQLTYWYCLIGILSIFIAIALIVPTITLVLMKIFGRTKNPIINMAINKIKTSSLQINTNIIFIVTVSVSLVTYSFFNYMKTVEKNKENAVNTDIYVEEKESGLLGVYDKTDDFFKLDGVSGVSTLYDIDISTTYKYDEIKFANNPIKDIHLIYSNDYEKLLKDSNLIKVDSNLAQNLERDEIIVSDYYKDIYNLKQGDTIVLSWAKNEENFTWDTPLNLKIVGFTDLSKIQNNTIIISSELGKYLNMLLFDGFSDVKYFINIDDKDKAKEIRKSIINDLGIYSNIRTGWVFTRDGYIKNVKDTNKQNIRFTIIIVVMIVGLSLIGIINNQTVSFMERRREIATLYSVAMSRKQLKDMILIENLISFINSSIASIVFYIIIAKLVEHTLRVLLLPIHLKFTISGILILLLVIVMILFGIQRTMRKHIKNMNIVEEIKYE